MDSTTLIARIREADFDHPRRDEPCRITTENCPAGWYARCRTHDAESDARVPYQLDAERDFTCDHGRRWYFIVHHRDDFPTGPCMVDLSGLKSEVRDYVQDAVGGDDSDLMAFWRYLLDGTSEPLDLTYNQDDEGDYECVVKSEVDGREYLRFTHKINRPAR